MMNRKKPLSYHIGNFLMVGTVLVALFIYFPVIALYINPPKISQQVRKSGFYLTIPKISAQAPVIANVDPWNEQEYLVKLQEGIAQASGSVNPGEPGEMYLFAHSSDAPWRMTRYNVAFFRLGELKGGDVIWVDKDGRRFTYVVYDRKELWPTQVEYLKALDKNHNSSGLSQLDQTLILQTCTPVGTSLKRLLIFAKPA